MFYFAIIFFFFGFQKTETNAAVYVQELFTFEIAIGRVVTYCTCASRSKYPD